MNMYFSLDVKVVVVHIEMAVFAETNQKTSQSYLLTLLYSVFLQCICRQTEHSLNRDRLRMFVSRVSGIEIPSVNQLGVWRG